MLLPILAGCKILSSYKKKINTGTRSRILIVCILILVFIFYGFTVVTDFTKVSCTSRCFKKKVRQTSEGMHTIYL